MGTLKDQWAGTIATIPSTPFPSSSSKQHALTLKTYIKGLENSKGSCILLGREEEKEILEGFLEKVTSGWVLKNGLEMDSREQKRDVSRALQSARWEGTVGEEFEGLEI